MSHVTLLFRWLTVAFVALGINLCCCMGAGLGHTAHADEPHAHACCAGHDAHADGHSKAPAEKHTCQCSTQAVKALVKSPELKMPALAMILREWSWSMLPPFKPILRTLAIAREGIPAPPTSLLRQHCALIV